jgi:hypothetical protein
VANDAAEKCTVYAHAWQLTQPIFFCTSIFSVICRAAVPWHTSSQPQPSTAMSTALIPMITIFGSYEGDNQISSRLLSCVADRVSLGLLPSAHLGIPLAVSALRERGGFMHVHGNCADTQQGIR